MYLWFTDALTQINFCSMITIYQSPYQKILFNPEYQIFEQIWLPESEFMNDDIYKKEFRDILNATEAYKGKSNKIFIDSLNALYVVSPELQEWHNEHVFSRLIEMGIKRFAVLLSRDLFTQVSYEQTFEEAENAGFQIEYFDDRAKAYAWLLGSQEASQAV